MTYEKSLKENKEKAQSKQVSVIIRNRNEERYIGFAIQSVLDHFNNPEILIIDNNSCDGSLEIAKSFNFANLKIFKIVDYTPGKALNLGAMESTYDNILILSAHSEIIKLDYKVDKDLIGGLKLQLGSFMIDTSIKNKLKKYEQAMLEN